MGEIVLSFGGWRRVPIGVFIVFMIFAIAGIARAGSVCTVPGEFSTLADAFLDASCLTINIDPGLYTGLTIDRTVTLIGSGPEKTVIKSAGAMSAIIVSGTGVFLSLQDLQLAAGNGPEPVLQTVDGGEILFATDIKIARGPAVVFPQNVVIFTDGFEQ